MLRIVHVYVFRKPVLGAGLIDPYLMVLRHRRLVSLWRHFAHRLGKKWKRGSALFNTIYLQKHHKQLTIFEYWDRFVWSHLLAHRRLVVANVYLDPFGLLEEVVEARLPEQQIPRVVVNSLGDNNRNGYQSVCQLGLSYRTDHARWCGKPV